MDTEHTQKSNDESDIDPPVFTEVCGYCISHSADIADIIDSEHNKLL